MQNIFTQGGGAGIGSYVVVFKNGQLDPETNLLKLRNAYEAGESIFFSVIDAETKDALVLATGWLDEESKLHLVARDFDDAKTYEIALSDAPAGSEIVVEVEVKDGIDLGGEELPDKEYIDEALATKANLVDGKVPASELPSYVDDIVEYPSVSDFPATGEPGKIYVDTSTNNTYRWAGTQYVQIGGAGLAAGDGIEIENDVVSVDAEYLNSNLEFVKPADIANDIEVIGYQDQEPISEEQLQKALDGKLAIYRNGRLYTKYFQNDDIINFHAFDISRNISSSITVSTILQSKEHVIILLRATRMLSDTGYMPVSAVGDDSSNFLAGDADPVADGKKLIRELNLVSALSEKADTSTVDAALALKADKTELEDIVGFDGYLEFQDVNMIHMTQESCNFINSLPLNANYWLRIKGPFSSLPAPVQIAQVTIYSDRLLRIYIYQTQQDGNEKCNLLRVVKDLSNNPPVTLPIEPTTQLSWSSDWVGPIPQYQAGKNYWWETTPRANSTKPVTSNGIYNALQAKQDTLVSGTNIKTVNGESLLGSGNIEIEGGDSDLVIVDTIDDLSPVGGSEGGLSPILEPGEPVLEPEDGLPAGDIVAPAAEPEVVPGDPSKIYLAKDTGVLYKYDAEGERYMVVPSTTYLIWEMNVTLQSDSSSLDGYRVLDFNGTVNGASFSSWEDFLSVVLYYGEDRLPQLIMCHVMLLVEDSPQAVSLTLPLFKDDSIQAWASHECRFIFAPHNNLLDSFEFAPFMLEEYLKLVADAGQAVSLLDYPLWYGSNKEYINLVSIHGDNGPFVASGVFCATPEGASTQIVTLLGGYQFSYIYNMESEELSATAVEGGTPTPEPTPEPTPTTITYRAGVNVSAWGWMQADPDLSDLPSADDFDPALYKPDTLLLDVTSREEQYGVMTRSSDDTLKVFLYDDAQQYMPGVSIILNEDQNHTFAIITGHLAIGNGTPMSFRYGADIPQPVEGGYLPITDGWYWCCGDPMR